MSVLDGQDHIMVGRPTAGEHKAGGPGNARQEDRRDFLKWAGLTGVGALVGMVVPFERNLPAGIMPVALAQDAGQELMKDKKGLSLLNDKPLNAETPAHLLDDEITPYEHLFVRSTGGARNRGF